MHVLVGLRKKPAIIFKYVGTDATNTHYFHNLRPPPPIQCWITVSNILYKFPGNYNISCNLIMIGRRSPTLR